MKITAIKLFPISLTPIKTGYRSQDALSQLARVNTVIVQIETDKDIVGWGEAATIPSYFNQTLGTLMDWLKGYAQALIGLDPRNIIQVHRRIDLVSGERPPGCQPARAAIDMALYDIIGKVNNCPVYEVLGGAYRTEFELQTNLYEESPEEKANACRAYVEKGFAGLKVKVGDSILLKGFSAANLEWERKKLLAALEAVPPNIYIDADANQTWGNAKIAVKIVEHILQGTFYPNLSLEQPLHHLDFSGHSYLRKILPIPIILDESVVSPEAMLQIVKMEAADRIVLKINRVGGFWFAKKIVDICEAACIGISIDTMPFTKLGDTAHCHLAATIRDPYPVDAEGHTWFAATPFTGGVEIQGGKAVLPRRPGLGVELDEKLLKKMLISYPAQISWGVI